MNLFIEVVIAVVTVTLAIIWVAHRQNEQAQEAQHTMVVGGVAALEDNLRVFANDYAWWEAGYDKLVEGDAAWVDENYGSGIRDTQVTDILVITNPDSSFAYGWAVSEDNGTPEQIFPPDVLRKVTALLADVPVSNQARQAYLQVENDILMVATARATPVSRADEVAAETLPYIIQGIYVTQARLSELGETFLANDLHLEKGAPSQAIVDAGYPIIKDIDGNTIGAVVWTPPRPGTEVLRRVALPVGIALALFCVLAAISGGRLRRLAIRLMESQQNAITAAKTDSLTRLTNRAGFNELLDSAEYRAACDEGHLAIIYLDVNGFKTVNDSIGHHGGDELVRSLADRLNSVLPAGAHFVRIGGDEFAIAMIGRNAREAAAGTASALIHALDEPFTVFGFEFHVSAAVGYAVSERTTASAAEVLRRADVAMYHAKNTAERDAVAYHPTMETGALEKKQIETALRKGLEDNELEVVYQPIVNASDLSLSSLEVLTRWTSKDLGPISPANFIPVAEETGLIHDIGRFVVRQVCKDLANWPQLRVAVNVSPVQLRDPNFANDLLHQIQEAGVSPSRLELEITEGILVSNPTIAKRKMEVLKKMGFSLSIDDFGTGFSSIGYLRQFPFDKLKVDRSFVRELGINNTANALVQALVSLGEAMDLDVVAEGIETDEQLKLLRLVRCGYIQGFLISKPLPAGKMKEFIENYGNDEQTPARSAESA